MVLIAAGLVMCILLLVAACQPQMPECVSDCSFDGAGVRL